MGYRVVLEDVKNKVFHYFAVIAESPQEAIGMARTEIGDTFAKKTVLFSIDKYKRGVILADSYRE
ncbi:hypothetical protein [Priestia megaterium]|uniref:hypothetical protein n=1 Tax=Priestia megaterium TaxID=1404 RepID=UPI00112C53FB|nr:hypothetical protein [Priestia megaterium]TPF17984.1 hypothetical protein CBE78_01800 [Priestia megaterium]TPF22092.1 hypothetical protein CBE79_04305 [Priestia megaterium]